MSLKYVNIQGETKGSLHSLPKNSTTTKRKKVIKRVLIGLGIFALLLVIISAISYPGVKGFSDQSKNTIAQARKVSEAWQLQDVIKAKEETQKLKTEIEKLEGKLNYFGWTKFIPLVGSYYRDGHHFIQAGLHGSDAGVIIADSLIPFADALGLKGGAAGNAEIYAQKVVEAMPKIVPAIDDLEEKMKLIREETDQINPKKYPKKIGQQEVRSNIELAIKTVDDIESFMPELRPLLMALPNAMGSPTLKTYLIIFQNDKELRSTGGFITAYAIARVEKGKLVSITSEDAYRLDDKVTQRPPVPSQLATYLKVNRFFIRDANISPDFVESMEIFERMYNSAAGTPDIDGIIGLDTEFVRGLIDVVGEVTVPAYNETFTSQINPQYGIPDVVYKLELYSQQLLVGTENRKDLVGQLMGALVRKVLSSDKDQWFPLLTKVQEMANQKHIVGYSHDKASQVLLEKYNYAGRIRDYEGDYLHFNSNNYAGLKGDAFVTQKIEQDLEVKDDGTIIKKVTFTNTNPSKVAVSWLNPTVYTNWLRLYVPEGSKLQGGNFNESEELGKQMYQTVIKTEIGKSNSVTFTYQLPFKVKKGEEYKQLIQKQPGTREPEVIIRVNGKQREQFLLDTDREIKFEI